jgi:glutathione S-transferase
MLRIVGRSSSHFTRVARMFAHALDVPYVLQVVPDLSAIDAGAYGDNPALKIPVLIDEAGSLFGADNVCRALARRAGRPGVVLRGEFDGDPAAARLVANAEELVLHAMTAEVGIILAKAQGVAPGPKLQPSIENCLGWLDDHEPALARALPASRTLSFVEVALYCLVTHLPWRQVMEISRWERLEAFARRYGAHPASAATAYRFDQA